MINQISLEKEDRDLKFDASTIHSLVAVVVVVSFLGYLVENIFLLFKCGFCNNRGMIFPFLLGYGFAILFVYIMFGTPDKPQFFGYKIRNNINRSLQYYIFLALTVGIGEILLGTSVEMFTGIVWWDYTSIPLHITKYTSVPTTAAFALMIFTFMKFFFKPVCGIADYLAKKKKLKILYITFALIIVDFIFSSIYMIKHGAFIELWHRNIEKIHLNNINIIDRLRDIIPF